MQKCRFGEVLIFNTKQNLQNQITNNMGCCYSSPYSRRRYRDPADLDEDFVPIRYDILHLLKKLYALSVCKFQIPMLASNCTPIHSDTLVQIELDRI